MFKIQWEVKLNKAAGPIWTSIRRKGEQWKGRKLDAFETEDNRKHSHGGYGKESLVIPHHFFMSPQRNYSII